VHPAFREAFLQDNRRELDRALRIAYLLREAERPVRAAPAAPVALRLGRVQDEAALDTLGRLEGRLVSAGCYVVAEVGGEVVAALPLGGGAPLADPFRATAHLLPLLELRARQLSGDPPGRRARVLSAAVRVFGRA
jgi:hypothetical protein